MRHLLATLVLAAVSFTARAQLELFPEGTTFRPLLADPAEPRLFLSQLDVKRAGGDFSAAFLGVGHDFGLLRWDGWQVSLFGSADSLFNLDLPGDALVNTDYRLGVPVAWRHGAWSARARVYHQSSHLGDELILGGNAPPRVDLSFEAIDFLVAWQRSGWRLYGGASRVVRSRTDSYEGSGLHYGFDYVSAPVLFGQRLTAGLDVKWLEQARAHSGVSAKAGVRLGPSSVQRGITLLVEVYDGFAPFGQFFVEEFRYRGARLQFDL
jgi:hypothetical protein